MTGAESVGASLVQRLWLWGSSLLSTLWRWMCQPWWRWAILAAATLLLAAVWGLPQLPSDVADNTTLATRWLNRASGDFGFGGELLRLLGLFDVLHSPLLRVLLIAVGAVSVVQLADSLSFGWVLRRSRLWLELPVAEAGGAILIPASAKLFRLRVLDARPAQESAAQLHTFVGEHYADFARASHALPAPAALLPVGPEEISEDRTLAWRHQRSAWLRPLFLLGQLLLIIVIGLMTVYGWRFSASSIAPGEISTYGAEQLNLRYMVPSLSQNSPSAENEIASERQAAQNALLEVRIGEQVATIDPDRGPFRRVGGVFVRARSGDPALLVRTVDGESLLLVPGEGAPADQAGLVFSEPGSESFVVLPQQAVALRVLRVDSGEQISFLVEIFDDFETAADETISASEMQPSDLQPSDLQPSDSLTVAGQQRIALADRAVSLEFRVMPALNVHTFFVPVSWLLVPALICLLLGGISLRQPSAFLLMQVVPWMDQSVVIAQSNARHERNRLELWLGTQRQGEPDLETERPATERHRNSVTEQFSTEHLASEPFESENPKNPVNEQEVA